MWSAPSTALSVNAGASCSPAPCMKAGCACRLEPTHSCFTLLFTPERDLYLPGETGRRGRGWQAGPCREGGEIRNITGIRKQPSAKMRHGVCVCGCRLTRRSVAGWRRAVKRSRTAVSPASWTPGCDWKLIVHSPGIPDHASRCVRTGPILCPPTLL